MCGGMPGVHVEDLNDISNQCAMNLWRSWSTAGGEPTGDGVNLRHVPATKSNHMSKT